MTENTHLSILKGGVSKAMKSIFGSQGGGERISRLMLLSRFLRGGRGRSCSWRSLSWVLPSVQGLREGLLTMLMPAELSEEVFEETADVITKRFPLSTEINPKSRDRIDLLNRVYSELYRPNENAAA